MGVTSISMVFKSMVTNAESSVHSRNTEKEAKIDP